MYIRRAPRILVLQLKRFYHTLAGSKKISERIDYPAVLDIAPFCDFAPEEQPPVSTMYRLFGVVDHEGSLNGGHYMAYVRREDGQWYRFNDSRVSLVTEKEVLTRGAYILFYERIES